MLARKSATMVPSLLNEQGTVRVVTMFQPVSSQPASYSVATACSVGGTVTSPLGHDYRVGSANGLDVFIV